MCRRHGKRKFFWFLFALPLFLGFFALVSYAVMLLWNELLPDLFGFQAIQFWQAAGLLLLSRILFGGWGRRPRPFYGRRGIHPHDRRMHGKHHPSEDESSDRTEG